MTADLADTEPGPLRVLSTPQRFARQCASVAVALAVLGLVGLVDPALVLPLAGLVLAVAGLALLIPVEERQHDLRADDAATADLRTDPLVDLDGDADPEVPDPDRGPVVPEPAPAPVVPEPEPGPVVPEPDPGPIVPEPAPVPVVPEPDPAPVVPEPDPAPVVPEPDPAPVVPEPDPAPVVPEPEMAIASATITRTFRLPASVGAERVWVAGEFNGWSRSAHPMQREGDAFVARIPLEVGRSYRYRYLLDGVRWENDWNADRYEPNAFGEDDSVVVT